MHGKLASVLPFLRQPSPYAPTQNDSLNALLVEFDKAAATGREAFVDLILFSERVAGIETEMFSQRGKFVDTLDPLYDTYLKLMYATTTTHAICAEYLFLRPKMCRTGPDSVDPAQIHATMLAFSRSMQDLSRAGAVINTQWNVATDALRVTLKSYCIPAPLASVVNWVDSHDARLELPNILDALPKTVRKSMEGLENFLAAYSKLEDALLESEKLRPAGSQPELLVSESDVGIALLQLIHLDTAVIRYRACLLLANRWTDDKPEMNIKKIASTPLRDLLQRPDNDFLLTYCGTRTPSWLSDYRWGMRTKDEIYRPASLHTPVNRVALERNGNGI